MENTRESNNDKTDTDGIVNCDVNADQCLIDKIPCKKDEPKSVQNDVFLFCCLWATVSSCLKAVSFSDVFSSIMYVADVISDFWSAMSFSQGKHIDDTMFENVNFTSYNEEICANLDEYSHFNWSIAGLMLLWTPAITLYYPAILIVSKTLKLICSCSGEVKILDKMLAISILTVTAITWPITGLIM